MHPVGLRDATERVHHARVELGAGDTLDLGHRRGMRLRAAIGPVGGNRVVRVGDGEQAGAEHDRLVLQARGVAASVEPFLVLEHDLARLA